MTSNFVRRRLVFAAMTGVLLSACATGSNHFSSHAAKPAVEREALKEAAAAVGETAWPKPETLSLGALLTGFISGDDDHVSKDDAVKAYVKTLAATDAPAQNLLKDAEHHLAAAQRLAEAADAAAASVRPVASDIAIVETAIGELREQRDIYLAALKTLEKAGEPAPADNADDVLKTSFNEAIKTIGAAADRLADRVDNDRSETLAQPAAVKERRATIGGGL